ncbi:hypothetical protein [Kosakonia sacchari]|uniref:hypothetical protein n=1 Tax=Kosakonia sacchari TaxID=1158459 RepID=UPI0015846AC9|nr:hypothetical protein [Kosakonia sacchari]NUL36345.1 hypothetical protein [Kosakonia sacchari]HDT2145340.1 hypothetical protein [Enterobacter roggenkampii]
MNIKSIILGLGLVAFTSAASAVDGYKGIKFGSDFNQLKAAKICTWKEYKDNKIKGMQTYYCPDFKFSGATTLATAIFLNDSFERLSIMIHDTQDVVTLFESLSKKYGSPSSKFTADELKSVQENGGSVTVKFDEDTVILSMNRDPATREESTMLLYSSPTYFDKLKQLEQKNMENDL